ncbi:hypothetical protein [Ureibacillus terrenus]|uniref:Uncharacterized protein n=1 Tax=Ureibacillus terrenus TaxID=118246 RepID=A0A540V1R7_9BACL|nr:hypothetical protein [Ureibacillus terrenus]TQE90695.1 hypothetical protein FKZ59_08025 [Ureibacillus terrenus]
MDKDSLYKVMLMEKEKRLIKNFKVIITGIFFLGIILFFSAMPEWNTILFVINLVVAAFFVAWLFFVQKSNSNINKYAFALLYALVFLISFIFPQFLIKLLLKIGTRLWLLLVAGWFIAFIVGLAHFFRESKIGKKLYKNPFKNRKGLIFEFFPLTVAMIIAVIIISVLIIYGLISLNELTNDRIKFIIEGLLLYIWSIILIGFSPLMLIFYKNESKKDNLDIRNYPRG